MSAAAEPIAAPDTGRITVLRDDKLLQRPRQVSYGVLGVASYSDN
jgi:hypothetical protein